MKPLAAIGLAWLTAVDPAARADPAAPRIAPRHGQREDTQRLREQLRGLDHPAPPAPTAKPRPRPPASSRPPSRGRPATR